LQTWLDLEYYAIGYHTGSKSKKEHAHIAVSLQKVLQKQSLDTRFKKLFNVKGPNYSSKLWDGSDKVLSYLYHDKAGKVDMGIPLTDEERKEVENLVTVYNEIVTTAKNKASNKLLDIVLDAIKESGEKWSERRIIEYIIIRIRSGHSYSMPQIKLECMLQDIMLRQSPTDLVYGEEVVDKYVDQFFLRYRR